MDCEESVKNVLARRRENVENLLKEKKNIE